MNTDSFGFIFNYNGKCYSDNCLNTMWVVLFRNNHEIALVVRHPTETVATDLKLLDQLLEELRWEKSILFFIRKYFPKLEF